MSKIQKIIPLLLCVCMAIIFKPTNVFADDAATLWVNGKNLASSQGKTVSCGEGTATYDPGNNTLTLDNATITTAVQMTADGSRLVYIGKNFSGLKIILVGANSILQTPKEFGLRSACNITITGSGSLDISGGQGALNMTGGSLTIDGTTVNLNASGGCISTTEKTDVVSIINNSKVTLNSSNTGDITGSVGGGFIVSDSELHATGTGAGLSTDTGEISIKNSVVEISSSSVSLSANYDSTVHISNSRVNLTSTGSNAIYAEEGTITIDGKSNVTASGYWPALWAQNAIAIQGGSTVKAVSTDDSSYGIYSPGSVSISGDSEVTATGGIKAGNGSIILSPVNGEKFDVLAGDDEQSAVPIPGSPFSEPVNLADLNLDSYPYVGSRTHVHVYDQEIVADEYKISDANCTSAAAYYKSCFCGEKGTETETFTVGDPQHSYGTEWKNDTTNHWHECSVCGDQTDVQSHTAGEWITDKEATSTEAGKQHKECSICSYVMETAAIPAKGEPAHSHSYGTEWKSDEVNHWHECACGSKTDISSHTSDEGKVTTAPTDSQTGVKTYFCSVCGRELKTEIIPVTKAAETPGTTSTAGTPGTAGTKTSSPPTGDTENMSLWIVLLILSGTGLALYSKKKKAN